MGLPVTNCNLSRPTIFRPIKCRKNGSKEPPVPQAGWARPNKTILKAVVDALGIVESYTLLKLNLIRDFSQHITYLHQQSTRTCNYSQLAYVIMIVISSSTNMHLAVHIDVSYHSPKLI